MDDSKKDMEEALRDIALMIGKTERTKEKFLQGTSQHTLQQNRLKALQIATFLISEELAVSEATDGYTVEEVNTALAPITSLISKSEKARTKLVPGSWQHTMLSNNLKALCIALPLFTKALGETNPGTR